MADTLTLHLSKQKQHIMIRPAIMANWFDLVQGTVDLFLLCPIRIVCHSLNMQSLYVCASVRIRPYTNKYGPESLEYCMSFNCHLHSGRIVTFWILTACRTHSSHCSLLPVTRLCQCQGLPVSPRSGTFVFLSSLRLFFLTTCCADAPQQYRHVYLFI